MQYIISIYYLDKLHKTEGVVVVVFSLMKTNVHFTNCKQNYQIGFDLKSELFQKVYYRANYTL